MRLIHTWFVYTIYIFNRKRNIYAFAKVFYKHLHEILLKCDKKHVIYSLFPALPNRVQGKGQRLYMTLLDILSRQHVIHLFQGVFFNKRSLAMNIFMPVYPAVKCRYAVPILAKLFDHLLNMCNNFLRRACQTGDLPFIIMGGLLSS